MSELSSSRGRSAPPPPNPIRLDRTDRAILAAVQRDAGLSNKELARRVRLAPSSCLERVRRLREEGILRGAHAQVDPTALGIHLQALIEVRLQHHQEREVLAWREQLLTRPEVVRLYSVSGSMDYVVHVAVRDVRHLRDLGAEALTSHRLVAQVETSLIFEQWTSNVMPDLALDEGETRR